MQLQSRLPTMKSALGGAGLAALLATTALNPVPAYAAETAAQQQMAKQIQDLQMQLQQVQSLQDQVRSLQSQLDSLKKNESDLATKQSEQEAAERAAALAMGGKIVTVNGKEEVQMPAPSTGGVQNKGIKLTFGGFIEAAGIYRNKNETADVGSTFSGIPFANSAQGHVDEIRGSARQSRISILAQGQVDKDTQLAAYYEMDFLGAAPTANPNESNSYQPRIRNIYATVDRTDIGLHLLAGQNWSLATLNKTGIVPRTEVTPQGIEAQYVVGFNWTRNPQVRLTGDFDDHKIWFAVSAESPQAQISGTSASLTGQPTLVTNNSGAAQLNNATSTYALDPAPDMIAKLAADPGWGHYEVYGIARWFRDRLSSTAASNTAGNPAINQTTSGGGVGGSAILPLVDKYLDFQASFLVGKGLGRYGSGQLSDVTYGIGPGYDKFVALPYRSVLLGAIAHPTPMLDIYGYAGTEQLKAKYGNGTLNGAAYSVGYGNPSLLNDGGCLTEGVGTCNGNNAREYEVTGGFWWKIYKGSYGYMQWGIQDQYVKRYVFSGLTTSAPAASINILMTSFRYYPF